MSRPKSWTPGYAKARREYNLKRARSCQRLADLANATKARYQSVYDWPSLYQGQADTYQARAAWWSCLLGVLVTEREDRKGAKT